ncbi:MAG: PEP-CTERM sorting domain-containing protein [Planctomycetia bacterium]
MRTQRISTAAAALGLVASLAACGTARGQTYSVTTAGDLAAAIVFANAWTGSGPYTINFATSGTIQPSAQMVIGLAAANTSGLVINGNGVTIDMSQANGGAGDRAFFVADGTVAFNNLTIANGNAVGGNGGGGAGGGAGLGGALFVANSGSIPGIPQLPTSVTLSGVQFSNNRAAGGAGGVNTNSSSISWNGGGGMGGNGGQGYIGGLDTSGGGGGGFGFGANGGNGSSDGNPGVTGAMAIAGAAAAGTGGYNGKGGGIQGGGGGGGNDGFFERGAGGGGGVGGASANGSSGGNGGFGGGGGSGGDQNADAGNGGFGGGGAAGGGPGSGGFGGGGGSGYPPSSTPEAQPGGFGGGAAVAGSNAVQSITYNLGGGGAGLGGAVFVMNGASLTVAGPSTFNGNTVFSGPGGVFPSVDGFGPFNAGNGSTYGPDLFVGGNVTLSPAPGQSLTVANLGGAGNLADANVSTHATDPNANGALFVTGGGLVALTGTSYLSGAMTVNSGTLLLSATATEQGASLVTVGQNAGDIATLQLGGSSFLTLGGFNFNTPSASTDQPVMIAENAGSTGQVVIGSGPGSNGAFIAARVFTGGSGTASVVFTQQYAAEAGTTPLYPFYTSLTGTLGIVQAGLGMTQLQPVYGPNTFTGAVTVNSGTLATTGTAAALAGASLLTVTPGGVLSLGQTEGVFNAAALTLAGGVLQTGTSLTETLGVLAVSGTGTSYIDFIGNSATLNFASLVLAPSSGLSIWNYSNAIDYVNITTGTAFGDLANVRFYSDSGSTFLGYGGFAGTQLVPVAVPEPTTLALLATGLATGCSLVRRRRATRSSVAHSP